MQLTLTVLRCPDRVAPETRVLEGGELVLGRGPGADWVLTDPAARPQISRRHCVVSYAAGGWTVTDSSTNGTTLNGEAVPQGRPSRPLRSGDRLRVGPYEIEAAVAEPAPWGRADAAPFGDAEEAAFGEAVAAPFGRAANMPFGGPGNVPCGPGEASPFGPMQPPPSAPIADPFSASHGVAYTPGGNQASITPLIPDDFAAEFLPRTASGTQPDHSPAQADVLLPPMVRPAIPQDWHLAAPEHGEPPMAAIPAALARLTEDWNVPQDAVADAPPPAAAGPAPAAPAHDMLLVAFLHGAGMADARPQDAEACLREAGAAFRAFVHGLRAVLIARAEVKSAFRISQTMVRTTGNNPLKFSAGDDDALDAMLGTGRRTNMKAAASVADALEDIRAHELASMAAMQAAVRALMDQLDPARFRAAAEGGLIAAQRRARAFDLYEAAFSAMREGLAEKLDDAFGRAFAEAYERVVAELQAEKRK